MPQSIVRSLNGCESYVSVNRIGTRVNIKQIGSYGAFVFPRIRV